MSILYIVLRSDLKWKAGPQAAQAAHAVSLLVHKYHEEMREYLDQGYAMRKVVLGANDKDFQKLKMSLESDKIKFVEWIEQPENIAVAMAVIPINPNDRPDYLKALKLFK
eukprot:NODE_223_length_13915_cov_0.128257.p9 type:complete len:110 gc:universal NODE_223_length_13915_cov_0.128257:9408-9079(-)